MPDDLDDPPAVRITQLDDPDALDEIADLDWDDYRDRFEDLPKETTELNENISASRLLDRKELRIVTESDAVLRAIGEAIRDRAAADQDKPMHDSDVTHELARIGVSIREQLDTAE